MSDSVSIPLLLLPNELIREILLRLPPKSLSKFMCVSKSWHQLISSPNFVNTHLKLTANHRVIFSGSNRNFKSSCLPPLIYNEQRVELFDVESPVEIPFISAGIVGSANGLICLFNQKSETFIWNPTTSTSKSKKLPKLEATGCFGCQMGFGYDELHDDYKIVFVHFYNVGEDTLSLRTVANIYSLRNDSWRTLHDQLQDSFLINSWGKFVNGKLYWVSTIGTGNGNRDLCITSLDLADETWGKLELPNCGKVDPNLMMGVVGSDLSLLYTSLLDVTTCDVWIMKHCGVNVSWTKLFTIKCPRYGGLCMPYPPSDTFSIHFPQLNKGEILLFLRSAIMIYDCSTRQLKHTVDVEGYEAAKFYVESLVNPLTISRQRHHIHETSQSFS